MNTKNYFLFDSKQKYSYTRIFEYLQFVIYTLAKIPKFLYTFLSYLYIYICSLRAGKKKRKFIAYSSYSEEFYDRIRSSNLIGSLISLFPSTSACTRFVIVYNSHGITIIDRSSNSTVESQTIITRTLQLQIIASRLRV